MRSNVKTVLLSSLLFILTVVPALPQTYYTPRWVAKIDNVTLTGSAYTVTVQQPSNAASSNVENIDQIVVYCSAACTISQSANGTAATSTSSSSNIYPILPTPSNTIFTFNFFTASNVGAGTPQSGSISTTGGTTTLCLSPSCLNPAQVILPAGGSSNNYSVTISGLTGTANVAFYGREVR